MFQVRRLRPRPAMSSRAWIEWVGLAIDTAGVLAILVGFALATVHYARRMPSTDASYRRYRQDLGRAILLGLELLVAGDIIRTVAIDPTVEGVLVLGLIVLIRTFLSFSLQIELEGRLPWKPEHGSGTRGPPEAASQG
jgi:uncharacterized membrane protein